MIQSHPAQSRISSSPEFDHLERCLRDFADGHDVVWITNNGNWGDAVIRQGTEAFFRRRGFRWKTLKFDRAQEMTRQDMEAFCGSGSVRVVYSGGGAFFRKYRMHKRMPKVIGLTDAMFVLPNSFSVPVAKLGFRSCDTLFRRDLTYSVDFAPGSDFCHDMAFSIESIAAVEPTRGRGSFFRTDKESSMLIAPPSENRDISAEGTDETPTEDFYSAIAEFSEIYTDRLHVSIAGALMGRTVHLYANSYFKNQSIFEASLSNYFPNVTVHPSAAGGGK